MPSPTQRTLAALKKYGATAQVVERWNSFAKKRVDLFGFGDVLAIVGRSIVAIQCTTGANHAARRAKILEEPKAAAWLKAGGIIEVWSFEKQGARGKRKVWTCRKEEIVLSEMAVPLVEA